MKTFVINLARSVDRRHYMSKQLSDLGIIFEFVDAVDGLNLDDKTVEMMKHPERSDFLDTIMKKGSYACLLSHHSVFKRMVDEQIPYAVVLEDDVDLSLDFKENIEIIEGALRDNEIVLLYSHNNYQKTIFSKIGSKTIGRRQLVDTMNVWSHCSAVGYIVTLEAAENLLVINSNVEYPFDTWGNYYDRGLVKSIRCVIPYPVSFGEFESDINYIAKNSMMGKLQTIIRKYLRSFPIAQILKYRRSRYSKKYSAYSMTNDPSPYFKE